MVDVKNRPENKRDIAVSFLGIFYDTMAEYVYIFSILGGAGSLSLRANLSVLERYEIVSDDFWIVPDTF